MDSLAQATEQPNLIEQDAALRERRTADQERRQSEIDTLAAETSTLPPMPIPSDVLAGDELATYERLASRLRVAHDSWAATVRDSDPQRFEREALPSLSEQSLTEAVMRTFQGMYAYNRDAGTWRVWGDILPGLGPWADAKDMHRQISFEIRNLIDADSQTQAQRWLSRSTFGNVEFLLREWLSAEWDTNPHVLGLPGGGKLDTRDGSIEQQSAQDHISRSLGTGLPDTEGISKAWDNFVWDCLAHYDLADRYAVKDYLQQWAGAALTGDCRDEAALFLYGKPGTGKSTFLETLAHVFGDYAYTVQGKRLFDHQGHTQWLAGCRDRRLVTIREMPNTREAWPSDLLNELISGGEVEANFMRQNSINFPSRAHVIFTGNHQPKADAASGLWRRLRLVQFQAQPETPNTALKTELRADLEGILEWCLVGLDAWENKGRTLDTPAVLLSDIETYRKEANPLERWFDECVIEVSTATTTAATMYESMVAWWGDNVSDKPPSRKSLGTFLTDHGYQSVSKWANGTNDKTYNGLGLLAPGS